MPADVEAGARAQFDALRSSVGQENVSDISNEMKKVMFDLVGIYRNEKDMQTAIQKVHELQQRYHHVRIKDTGKIFKRKLNAPCWKSLRRQV